MYNHQETGRSWHFCGENNQKTRNGGSRSLTQGLETDDRGPWAWGLSVPGLPGGVMVPEVSQRRQLLGM